MPVRTLGALALALAALGAASAQDEAGPPKKAAPPYPTAHDRPLEPKEQVVAAANDHTQLRVEFNGVEGDRVPGYLYVPKRKGDGAKGPFPAILLQYGTGGNKKTDYIVAVGKQFVGRGYVVLTIDAPGRGERGGKGKKAGGPLGMFDTKHFLHYCGDYSRAVDFLLTRPEVDKLRVGYVGISWGAITGITYAAHDERVKAVGSMVGGGNFLGLYKPAEAARAEGADRAIDPVCHVARIAPRPLLLLNVTRDQMIPREWAEALHKAAGAGAKVTWVETDHYFRSVDRAAVCESVIDFMDGALARKAPAGTK